MSPGGQNGLAYIVFGLIGAGIVFGVAWLVTVILPFVPTLRFGSTTGWVFCVVGLVAGYLLCQGAIDGWRETLRSWAMWALIAVPLFGLSGIVAWYINANPDSVLVETIIELVKKLPGSSSGTPLIYAFVGGPILLFMIFLAFGLFKYYTSEDFRRRRD